MSEPPPEIAHYRVVLDPASELTEIDHLQRELTREIQIETGFNQGRIARERYPSGHERRAVALECKRCRGLVVPKACCHAAETPGVSTKPFVRT